LFALREFISYCRHGVAIIFHYLLHFILLFPINII
jgi:hypothetical protein